MSTYPILFHNKTVGTLETARDGLYTVFTARCAPVADRLRLSVFGDHGSAYLGLLLPENGALRLRKRLSRLQCAALPDPIRYAAEEAVSPPAPEDSGWRAAADGTLRRTVSGRAWVAVPAERVRAPGVPAQLLRTIGGREYLVFPI